MGSGWTPAEADAHLAAIAIAQDATLASFDADFHRFEELRFEFLG